MSIIVASIGTRLRLILGSDAPIYEIWDGQAWQPIDMQLAGQHLKELVDEAKNGED